jgi:hypothetical protein
LSLKSKCKLFRVAVAIIGENREDNSFHFGVHSQLGDG